jgi:hypothetical protein
LEFSNSLARKYGTPASPISPSEEPLESVMRFVNMLQRAAYSSGDESEIAEILRLAKGKPEESRIAWEVANNPHASEETFSKAKANERLRENTTDENIESLNVRRSELKKQRKLPT